MQNYNVKNRWKLPYNISEKSNKEEAREKHFNEAVYIREDFTKKAKIQAVIEGKRLQEVLDEILAEKLKKGKNDGKQV